jgi:hypothetical protein
MVSDEAICDPDFSLHAFDHEIFKCKRFRHRIFKSEILSTRF